LPSPEGAAQAKNYAAKLAVRFTYANNGQGLYAIDMQTGQIKAAHRKKLGRYLVGFKNTCIFNGLSF
jgi:hypothetical protein